MPLTLGGQLLIGTTDKHLKNKIKDSGRKQIQNNLLKIIFFAVKENSKKLKMIKLRRTALQCITQRSLNFWLQILLVFGLPTTPLLPETAETNNSFSLICVLR